ncbi:MAG: tRNA (adenosine(37)-N6)-dimethylallyltransferase MiaA [Deltaproteobacteria bacterium]
MTGSGSRLLVLSGPTASGKTALALAMARRFPLEIVNADSVQVYRGMDIGSGKPTAGERGAVPHHLIDVADPDEDYSAGRFVAESEAAIRAILARGRIPLVAGGTGMYIRALRKGLDPLPADPAVRARLNRRWEEEGGSALHAELGRIDPDAAERIHPADRVRVVRALEISAIAGRPASALRVSWAGAGRYTVLFLALDPGREATYGRIDRRVDAMFRHGFVEEVRGLLGRGYGPELKPMGALGYRHVAAHLIRGVSLAETVDAMKRDTRRYAKRQMTWLLREPDAVWLRRDPPVEYASELARKFLS